MRISKMSNFSIDLTSIFLLVIIFLRTLWRIKITIENDQIFKWFCVYCVPTAQGLHFFCTEQIVSKQLKTSLLWLTKQWGDYNFLNFVNRYYLFVMYHNIVYSHRVCLSIGLKALVFSYLYRNVTEQCEWCKNKLYNARRLNLKCYPPNHCFPIIRKINFYGVNLNTF